MNKQGCLLVLFSAFKTYPADQNFVPRWCFELGQPLVKPKLVNKFPPKMRKFHDWYMKKSFGGLEMFGMLVRTEEFSLLREKVV
jgi:hypothetical protein